MRIVVGMIVLLGLSVGLSAQDAPDLSTQLNAALKASADKDATIAKLEKQNADQAALIKQAAAPKLTFEQQVAQWRKTLAAAKGSAFATACRAEHGTYRAGIKAGQVDPSCEGLK